LGSGISGAHGARQMLLVIKDRWCPRAQSGHEDLIGRQCLPASADGEPEGIEVSGQPGDSVQSDAVRLD